MTPPTKPTTPSACLPSQGECLGSDPATHQSWLALSACLWPQLGGLVDGVVKDVLGGSSKQSALGEIARQANSVGAILTRWLSGVFGGPLAPDGAESGAARGAGRDLAALGVTPCIVLCLTGRIRHELVSQLQNDPKADPAQSAGLCALHQAMDLETVKLVDGCLHPAQTQRLSEPIDPLAAALAHELRTPLCTIETSAYLLEQRLTEGGSADADVLRQVAKVRREVLACSKIISGLWDLTANRPPSRVLVSVGTVLGTVLELASPPIGVSIIDAVPSELTVLADPHQLRQILLNLVCNALQAVGERGTVRVAGCAVEAGIELRVSDDGPGVAPPIRSRLFEPRFSTKAGGMGLGLSLSRRYARAHGGDLVLEPTDRGSSFLLSIPDQG